MPKATRSAGILLYRRREGRLEVFLVHPGGPFWRGKEERAWSIPKGEIQEGEEALQAARREFAEETGFVVEGDFVPLSPVRQPGGKLVHAWALEGDCEAAAVRSNAFTMEWPPRSGRLARFPEIDKAAWFPISEARTRLHAGQIALLDQLEARLS